MFGFYRVAAAAPQLEIGDPAFNAEEIKKLILSAEERNCRVVVFPELALTGYTCGDLFNSAALLNQAELALYDIRNFSAGKGVTIVLGSPLVHKGRLYNCAVVIQNGFIHGVIPKSYLPVYREFYEPRWFTSGLNTDGMIEFSQNQPVPFGDKIIFKIDEFLIFGVELCEDLWAIVPPSSYHAAAGATLILNASASNELVSKADYRRTLVSSHSARAVAAYAYASSGVFESSTDTLYSGHLMISENGVIFNENSRFQRVSELITADIDCERLSYIRRTETSYSQVEIPPEYRTILLENQLCSDDNVVDRFFDKHPFVPSNESEKSEHCSEIFNIQKHALATRMQHTGIKKAVIGISGGLDSTLALLVTAETFKLLNIPPANIITVTMPGFGTTSRTLTNALDLIQFLGTSLRKIDITDVCLQHFNDIGHNPDVFDVTYENVQARERTQILMDIANKESALVIGTGDLSEIALGWSTYNGDHMSSYAVNCSVPKTLIRYLIHWVASTSDSELQKILEDIIDTPVSPELLPKSDDGRITQKTEDILGPYELHDFFLYHMIKYGAEPEKILFMATKAFDTQYKPEFITTCLKTFIRRFFTNQFKRSCIPDGPKVGTISLSPRGDWRMPSDASFKNWINKL
jgi:NAD+ synthase (glutamine-hydrolysing)